MKATLWSPYLLSWQLFIQGTSWRLPMDPMISLPYSHTIFITNCPVKGAGQRWLPLSCRWWVRWSTNGQTWRQRLGCNLDLLPPDQCSTPYTPLTKWDGRLRWGDSEGPSSILGSWGLRYECHSLLCRQQIPNVLATLFGCPRLLLKCFLRWWKPKF